MYFLSGSLRRRLAALCVIFVCLCGTACKKAGLELQNGELFAMDTYMTWQVLAEPDSELSYGIREKILETEAFLAVTGPESEVYQLNHRSSQLVELSVRLSELLRRCLKVAEETSGAFSPALYPLVNAWGFTTGENKVPSEEEREGLLPLCDWRKLELTGHQLTLEEGMALDFGAVGKGYVTETCVSYLKEQGVSSALLNLGGNIYALGSRPDGEAWRVGVELPFSDGGLAGVLASRDTAVITSGNYQRFFEADGKRYHHIMDGSTGAPAESGLDSVTIVSPDPFLADALSTAYFVMGLEQAAEDWRSRENIEVIWITSEGKIYYTEGLEGRFTVTEGLESEMIKK